MDYWSTSTPLRFLLLKRLNAGQLGGVDRRSVYVKDFTVIRLSLPNKLIIIRMHGCSWVGLLNWDACTWSG
jgi:hypothetical protein